MTEDDISTDLIEDEGIWPLRKSRVLDWLVNRTSGERFIDNILVAMCERLVEAGVPVARVTLHLQVNHPQWRGARSGSESDSSSWMGVGFQSDVLSPGWKPATTFQAEITFSASRRASP